MVRSPVARSALALFAAALAMSMSGCGCKGPQVSTAHGEIGVIWRDADGNRIVNRDATYDFGHALIGQSVPKSMLVRNTGAARLTLSKLELSSGDPVTIAGDVVANAAFTAEFNRVDLEPSQETEFALAFTPQALQASFESHLTLYGEGTRPEDATAAITLLGTGEKGACDIPATIDFGNVPVGETLSYTLPITNPTSVSATGSAGDLTGADAASFGYDPSSAKGTFTVGPASTANVIFTFSPTEKRAYTASVQLQGAGACPITTVTITGTGSDDVLTWAPTSLVYGLVSPPYEKGMDVVFTNLSNVPITLHQVQSSMPNDFSHDVPAGQDATVFTVPGHGVPTPLTVTCHPSGLGHRTATFTFNTGLRRTPSGTIALDCTGGGPKIRVTPRPTLAFGRVGFFPGSTTFNVTRKVTVQNVGTLPNPPDASANLQLGSVDATGMPGQFPLWDLVPAAGTDPSEIAVQLGSNYPSTGLPAIAGQNFVDLGVKVTPLSVGLKEADLTIHSNDSTEPNITVHISADAQQLPPCNISVSPSTGNFGLVTPGTTKDLPITITNTGTAATDVCYLSGIDLAAGTSPAYSIVGGPVVEKELQPQESYNVVVRVAPPGPVPSTLQTLTGTMVFNVTDPTNPQRAVQLRTNVGPSCLAITPDPLDFGTVKQGCNSAARTFNIYNTCSTPVALTGFSMQAGAGQPPGGPQCAGATPCPEFFITQQPAIPAGGLTLNPGAAPVTFQAKYHPIDLGTDSGAIAVNAIQSGQSITYLVGLQGRGDAVGVQTDTFTQDLRPKADILLVIDDSGSMSDKQTNLGNNFASFIQYAVAANVDYQIGITTTTTTYGSACPPGLPIPCPPINSKAIDGKLRNINGTTILKQSTPNVASLFAQFVNVGTDGSGTELGLEPAVAALTPPLTSAENAGFLRADANLAVVVVSDAGDQSPQAVSYYQNRLLNVKGFNRLSMFTFNNIGPYSMSAPLGCTYDNSSDPSRYLAVVTATSGIHDEICTTNWSATLQGLGRTAFGFRTQFYLGNVPDTSGSPIQVSIDGTPAPAGSWTYDAAANAVTFTPTTTPGPGQTLTVTYHTACF